MPTYEYECGKCGRKFSEFVPIKDRRNVRCECGELAIKLISLGSGIIPPFQPMWFNDICEKPLYIESKSQLRDECKKHDVIACRLL